ncbi:DEAD/DEAH box helicase [Streptacidiphilus sp. EB103A]|uniref:DEAD/DEAH box helicase n=1 Tax=Streptacidiphilus sp. EB103A TaxID=3156275 RepID=UPI00351925F7
MVLERAAVTAGPKAAPALGPGEAAGLPPAAAGVGGPPRWEHAELLARLCAAPSAPPEAVRSAVRAISGGELDADSLGEVLFAVDRTGWEPARRAALAALAGHGEAVRILHWAADRQGVTDLDTTLVFDSWGPTGLFRASVALRRAGRREVVRSAVHRSRSEALRDAAVNALGRLAGVEDDGAGEVPPPLHGLDFVANPAKSLDDLRRAGVLDSLEVVALPAGSGAASGFRVRASCSVNSSVFRAERVAVLEAEARWGAVYRLAEILLGQPHVPVPVDRRLRQHARSTLAALQSEGVLWGLRDAAEQRATGLEFIPYRQVLCEASAQARGRQLTTRAWDHAESLARAAASLRLLGSLLGEQPAALLETVVRRSPEALRALEQEGFIRALSVKSEPDPVGGAVAACVVSLETAQGDPIIWHQRGRSSHLRAEAAQGALRCLRAWIFTGSLPAAAAVELADSRSVPPRGAGAADAVRRELDAGARLVFQAHQRAVFRLEHGRATTVPGSAVPRPGDGIAAGDLSGQAGAEPWLVTLPVAAAALAGEPGPWSQHAMVFRQVVLLALEAVAAGQVYPSADSSSRDSWRLGPLTDHQLGAVADIAAVLPADAVHPLPIHAHGDRGADAREVVVRVLDAVADTLVRSPGAAAVFGVRPFTAAQPRPLTDDALIWLDTVSEIADAVPPPGVVVMIEPPPRAPGGGAHLLHASVRIVPADRPGTRLRLGEILAGPLADTPSGLRARRALRKAASAWPALQSCLDTGGDSFQLTTQEAALLLGRQGLAVGRAGIEIEWTHRWVHRLRTRLVTGQGWVRASELGLRGTVDYRWQVSADGQDLTAQEMDQVALQPGDLTLIRDRWHFIDDTAAERAGERTHQRAVPAATAVVSALLGTVDVDGQPVELQAQGGIAELVRLLQVGAFEPVPVPAALTARLRSYQERGFSWLANLSDHFGCILADDMGLGKSITAIALHLHHTQHSSNRLPTLVVAPASMLTTWVREVEKFAPQVPVHTYHGPSRSLAGVPADGLVVTTYGTLLRDQDELAGKAWGLVVADELQQVKNSASLTAKALARLNTLRRVGLTGTPLENRLKDLWSLLDWANPGMFGTHAAFRTLFRTLESDPDSDSANRLMKLVGQVMLRRRKTDPEIGAELPAVITTDRPLQLTARQRHLYTRTAESALSAIAGSTAAARPGQVLRLLLQLRQICNTPDHLRFGNARAAGLQTALAHYDAALAAEQSAKLAALDDLVPDIVAAGESALAFTSFATMALLLQAHALSWGVQAQLYIGGQSTRQRQATIDGFRAGQSPLLIATYGAGGTGLTLTNATHVILADPPLNPARVDQAVGRAHRLGQQRNVQVHHLTTVGTVEEKIMRMLQGKRALADLVLPDKEISLADLTDQELAAFVTLGGTS